VRRIAECGGRDRTDRGNVAGKLASNDHHRTVGPSLTSVNAFSPEAFDEAQPMGGDHSSTLQLDRPP
jgi:hypothetical protein